MINIVLIGGGSGISAVLRGLKFNPDFYLCSISTPTDDGGSTGKILKIYKDLIPLGDVRNCIASMSDDEIIQKLLQYRFNRAEFKTHALGNLILLALYKISNNNIIEFTENVNKLFKIRGKALTSSIKKATLVAKLSNNKIVKGQTTINKHLKDSNLKIEYIYLEGISERDVNPLAIQAILQADIILVGPGSLYSSIIPNFLIKPILQAYQKSKAKKIYISNLLNQPNECKECLLSFYLKTLNNYGITFDYILFNNQQIPKKLLYRYRRKDRRYDVIVNDVDSSHIIQEDLIDQNQNYIRHDGRKISTLISNLILRR
ncbi:MAG: uridine diphosphate-N-acetylglucosamine-binding protein YvcK [bacterium]